ncbi:uncharacterized protein LOC102613028 isoform X2 [Citrus sinensis]|uniref:uncharacterized protein LOC18050522 isoform X2 n=1 Tax=Citrus clementina TaxID=85681 RepID=UPI000CED4C38|nr:uncharacterized protein LOC18050522 isoform X2 [Citrus x clementina]XP_024951298.1 uncharacterized protein LOC102613028 isoform X2 [Citrus sinensis]
MVNKAWKIIPRPLLETVLNNHAQHHRVPQPLIIHGPRGVGKTTLFLERLLKDLNKEPHLTGYVDFAESIKDHHPQHNQSFPWSSWSNCEPPTLSNCKAQLETCLESMAERGIKLGTISSQQIFTTLNKWHGLNTALRRILSKSNKKVKNAVSDKVSGSVLWERAVYALSARVNAKEIDGVLELRENGKRLSLEEETYLREGLVALKLAKEVLNMQHEWRANAIANLNRTGGFSRSLANSCTDWPCLLIDLLSQAAEIDRFQTFGWTPQEAKMHMVTDYFSNSEWTVIAEVLGPNPRHLFELYALKQSNYYQKVMEDRASTFEDIVDAYLAYLQITVVNPAMDKALLLLQKFAFDAKNGRVLEDKLRFGAPWRHPPRTDDTILLAEWAKIQLMDFVQALVRTEFGVNYLADCSLEIFDDPAAVALLEVGLLYAQRDPSFMRPISRGIQRCLVRWLVLEQMKLSFWNYLQFHWQRFFRGRSYRHLMLQDRT